MRGTATQQAATTPLMQPEYGAVASAERRGADHGGEARGHLGALAHPAEQVSRGEVCDVSCAPHTQ